VLGSHSIGLLLWNKCDRGLFALGCCDQSYTHRMVIYFAVLQHSCVMDVVNDIEHTMDVHKTLTIFFHDTSSFPHK